MPKPLIQTTGRRKEAVARVRVRNGTGKITVNGRPFATYFPILTHQVIAKEPLRLTQTEEVYDVEATLDGGGVSGQAGAIRLGIAACADRARSRHPARAQEGRTARTRRAREGAPQVRPQEGPQGAAVLQALDPPHVVLRFGTDGVRGDADTDLTTRARRRALGRAAARVLGAGDVPRRARHARVGAADRDRPHPRVRRGRRVGVRRSGSHPRPRSRSSRSGPDCPPRSCRRATTRGATTA